METKQVVDKAPKDLMRVPLRELHIYNDHLTTFSEIDLKKLSNNMLQLGFLFPFFVYQQSENSYIILDGSLRKRALDRLEIQNVNIPESVPIVKIHLESEENFLEAIRQYSEFYADIDTEQVNDIFDKISINLEHLTIFKLPKVDLWKQYCLHQTSKGHTYKYLELNLNSEQYQKLKTYRQTIFEYSDKYKTIEEAVIDYINKNGAKQNDT